MLIILLPILCIQHFFYLKFFRRSISIFRLLLHRLDCKRVISLIPSAPTTALQKTTFHASIKGSSNSGIAFKSLLYLTSTLQRRLDSLSFDNHCLFIGPFGLLSRIDSLFSLSASSEDPCLLLILWLAQSLLKEDHLLAQFLGFRGVH